MSLNYENAIFYNESSALKLGWEPNWFGCAEHDEDLVDAIAAFQKEFGLSSDGMCGAKTYRRVFLDRESEISEHEPDPILEKNRFGDYSPEFQKEQNYIVYNGEHFPIDWKVILWDEEGGLKASKGKYREVIGSKRDIKTFCVHWDVCFSSRSCWKVLEKRGISVHFMIDGKTGIIYQSCDLNHIAWHAGGRSWNNDSIGVEMNNPYYLKYQGKNGVTRPIAKGVRVHGSTLEDHLDFTEVQKNALTALCQAIHEACGIPLQTPDTTTVYPPAVNGEYRGIIHHYHLKRSKIDSAGLDLNAIIN